MDPADEVPGARTPPLECVSIYFFCVDVVEVVVVVVDVVVVAGAVDAGGFVAEVCVVIVPDVSVRVVVDVACTPVSTAAVSVFTFSSFLQPASRDSEIAAMTKVVFMCFPRGNEDCKRRAPLAGRYS